MILTEKRFRAERGRCADTYQGFYATLELEGKRRFMRVELDNTNRWRSREEYADYLRWAADKIMTLPIEDE